MSSKHFITTVFAKNLYLSIEIKRQLHFFIGDAEVELDRT